MVFRIIRFCIFSVRAWCLLEVFYSTKNDVPFEVYLTEEQRMQFLDLAQRDPVHAALIFSRISTRQSTCWVLNDQLRIHSLIESSVGFEAVDNLVREAIARALQVPQQTQTLQLLQPDQDSSERKLLTFDLTTEEKKHSLMSWCRTEGDLRVEDIDDPAKISAITIMYYK